MVWYGDSIKCRAIKVTNEGECNFVTWPEPPLEQCRRRSFILSTFFAFLKTKKKKINKLKRVPSRICKQVKFPWVEYYDSDSDAVQLHFHKFHTMQTNLTYIWILPNPCAESVCPSVLINITCLGYVCRVVSGDKTPPATPTPTPWSVPRMGIGRECFRCYWCIYI